MDLGWLEADQFPRLISCQDEGCAPIVRAFESGADTAERWEGAATRAGGLRVPQAVGDKLILAALRESGGTAVAVSEEALTEAQGLVGRLMGAYVAPESGAAFAAVRALRERGDVGALEEVVVFDCGIGQKYPPPPGLGTAAGYRPVRIEETLSRSEAE